LDRNFFGRAFYDTNKERLQNLKMSSLISEGNVVRYQQLLDSSGVPFTQVIYLRLLTAGNFAIEKYAGKPKSNGTTMSIKVYVCKAKKGSKRFRRVLAHSVSTVEIENLRVVQTFFGLLSVPIPDPAIIGKLHGIWTWQFLSNRIRFFVFQFYNNSLGTKTRIAARYRNAGNILDQRCTFCLKSGSLVPMREDFIHVFYDCPYVTPLVARAYDVYFKHRLDDAQKKLCYLTGTVETYQKNDSFLCIDVGSD
jgi:hypothetical protein